MVKKLHCSFCGKDETKVAKLVAGPGVYICDECVKIANQIIKDSSLENNAEPPARSYDFDVETTHKELQEQPGSVIDRFLRRI